MYDATKSLGYDFTFTNKNIILKRFAKKVCIYMYKIEQVLANFFG